MILKKRGTKLLYNTVEDDNIFIEPIIQGEIVHSLYQNRIHNTFKMYKEQFLSKIIK